MVMIGKGSLKESILQSVEKYCITSKYKYIEAVRNKDIHKYYKASDFFVNLNDKEIFGMSILEAMYQGCVVVAKKAPGPSYIVQNNITGYVVHSIEDYVHKIEASVDIEMGIKARNRIIENFTWSVSAKRIVETINNLSK